MLSVTGECLDFCIRLEDMAHTIATATATPPTHSHSQDKSVHTSSHHSQERGQLDSRGQDTSGERHVHVLDDDLEDDWSTFVPTFAGLLSFFTGYPSGVPDNAGKNSGQRFFPGEVSGSRSWAASRRLDSLLGKDGLTSLLRSKDEGTARATMLVVAIGCADLIAEKRFYGAALVALQVLAHDAALDACYAAMTSAAKVPLAAPHESIQHTTLLQEVVRSLRLQKVLVGQLAGTRSRLVSTTALRQLCEQELHQRHLRSLSVAAPSATTPLHKTASRDSTHSADVPQYSTVASTGTGTTAVSEGKRSMDETASRDSGKQNISDSRPFGKPGIQFELDESLFWQSVHSAGRMSGVELFGQGGVTVRGLLRALVVAAVLIDDRVLSVFLLMLLDRPDLAALCTRPRGESFEIGELLFRFCVGDEQLPALSGADLRELGIEDVAVQLQGVLLSQREESVIELVQPAVEAILISLA